MKKSYLLLTCLIILCEVNFSFAQDIPLFSQKLTNSFMYNPAIAGHNMGSLTYSFRQSYGGVANAPKNHFISAHAPLAGHKVGIGLNFYQEDVNFIKNTYASAAFAYHVRLSKASTFSMGVSGEYNFMRLNGATNSTMEDPDYVKLANGELNDYDFSFGMLYQNQYVKAGFAANRMATAWIKNDSATILSSFYSGFVQGMIPLRNGSDLLEPYIAFRKFSETNDAFDIGLYYTYNSKIMAGLALRKGSVGSVTAGFYLTPKLFVGYTREMFFSDINAQVGSTNEFTLRLDFNSYESKGSFSNNYKNSLAYRRKTMNNYNKGSKSPSQLHRNQKKISKFSPNKRYQNVRKLSVTPSSQRVKKNKYRPPVKKKKRKR